MNADLIIAWIRGLLLLGLLSFFGGSLVVGLMQDDIAGGFGRQPLGTGQDPGVRVLIANRYIGGKEAAEAKPVHERVDLAIYQPVSVVTPDQPDSAEHQLTLPAGSVLMVLTDANDGLVLSSREWGTGGREVRWQVTKVVIQPQKTVPAATTEEAAASPARRDPTSFEASNNDEVFGIQGRRYRGSVEISWASAKEMRVVNCLPIEAYVDGVVAVEMSSGYPLEALKAQAIVSRSYGYAKAWSSRVARRPFDVVDGIDDQDYRGTGNGPPIIARAVGETRGIVTFTDLPNGSYPFAPLFSASSGGYTASLDTVFPDYRDAPGHVLPITTMPAQPDPYCQAGAEGLGKGLTHWQTTEVITPGMIRQELRKMAERTKDPRLEQLGFIKDLRVGRRSKTSNRVETVVIHHTLGEPIELPAHLFRMAIGPGRIRSTLWSPDSPKRIDSQDDKLTKNYQITSLGWGHGVGMSQISAWEMARQGWVAKNILGYFYPRVELRTLW
jgi:peptidoglycan hydrolase-like amidase